MAGVEKIFCPICGRLLRSKDPEGEKCTGCGSCIYAEWEGDDVLKLTAATIEQIPRGDNAEWPFADDQ